CIGEGAYATVCSADFQDRTYALKILKIYGGESFVSAGYNSEGESFVSAGYNSEGFKNFRRE
ncbi:17649_t:CDS:1, partial [Racocetra persica]